MSIEYFFVRDVTIVHPALVASGYGTGMDEDFGTATNVKVKGWVHQLSEQEQLSATRDTIVSTHVLRLPRGTVIGPSDRVMVDGVTFEVNGRPNRAWVINGEHHVRVNMTAIDG